MSKQAKLPTLDEFLTNDLNYICGSLQEEFEILSGKKMLITGGAGFLGYYLILSVLHWNDKYASTPIKLTVFDNFFRGKPDWLAEREGSENLKLVKHDMIEPLPDMEDYDYIVHAAGIASPIYYRQYPIRTMDTNITGLRSLLEYSLQQQVKGNPIEGFMFYSSSEIYGDPEPDMIPTAEDYPGRVSCTGPRACYDESKRYGETLCVNFALQYDLPIKISRPFNNYGPGLKITDARVIPDFSRNVLNDQNIVMYSDGKPTRTFCYSADAIIGYYKVLVKGHKGESYNIGIDKPEISMKRLAEIVVEKANKLFGYEGRLVHEINADKEYLTDNPNRRCPIIDKAKNHLNYSPTVHVEEGVERSLIWYYYNQVAEEA